MCTPILPLTNTKATIYRSLDLYTTVALAMVGRPNPSCLKKI